MVENQLDNTQEIISVSEINKRAKSILEENFPFVWIQGEVSNFFSAASGHWYFSLKDESSEIRCAMFTNKNHHITFEPKDGDHLVLNGTLSIFEGRGQYQIIVEHIELAGEGALLKAFEELKKKLQLEGLFDDSIKRQLPAYPKNIAVVTSPDGAVIQDIINVLDRRSPFLDLTVVPTLVQGEKAAPLICDALNKVGKLKKVDVVILARGGGSIEDLWAFNNEEVARAIVNCPTPIISAVGHETDFTISDFVSDLRAPTPSAAAEIISQNHSNLFASLTSIQKDLSLSINNKLVKQNEGLKNLSKLIKHPGDKLREISQKIDGLEMHLGNLTERIFLISRNKISTFSSSLKEFSPIVRVEKNKNRIESSIKDIKRSIEEVIGEKRNQFLSSSKTLEAVSPLSVLSRGYSILTKGGKEQVINSYAQVNIGDEIKGKLKEGQILTKVIEVSDEN